MPIHLTSRRSFLKGVVGAGAGWFLHGCSQAGRTLPATRASMGPAQWAFVSDTHIHVDLDHVEHGGRMSERFKLVLADILATNGTLDGMLIDGDVAFNHGEPGDYAAMVKLLEPARRAGLDLHLIVGNHDDRSNLLKGFFGDKPPAPLVPDRVVSVVESGGVRMIMLDSLIRPNYTPGRLGPEQLQWLARELDANPDRPSVLFLHHFLRGSGPPALLDEKELTEMIVPRRQVKAVIAGHSHEYRYREAEGIHFVELPATGYALRPGQPLGWVRAHVGPNGCDLELRAVAGDRALHGQVRRLTWRSGTKASQAA
jgi:Icc protein